MESKYTKGPWYCVNYAGFYQIQSQEGYTDSDVLNEEVTDRAGANAKLAAAAPELLEFATKAYLLIEAKVNDNLGLRIDQGTVFNKEQVLKGLEAAILKATSI